MTFNSPKTCMTKQICSVNRPISLNKWFNKLLHSFLVFTKAIFFRVIKCTNLEKKVQTHFFLLCRGCKGLQGLVVGECYWKELNLLNLNLKWIISPRCTRPQGKYGLILQGDCRRNYIYRVGCQCQTHNEYL